MEIASLIRDWAIAGFVLYIGIRYGILRDQERAAYKAHVSQLEGMRGDFLNRAIGALKGETPDLTQLAALVKELRE